MYVQFLSILFDINKLNGRKMFLIPGLKPFHPQQQQQTQIKMTSEFNFHHKHLFLIQYHTTYKT